MTLVSEIPDLLRRRYIPRSAGLLTETEVALLSLVDDSGKIPNEEKLQDFMAVLLRLEKTEHRALSLEILRRHLCEELQRSFVSSGGFRLLRQWLEDAEEERQPAMLVATIRACRLLPFDRTAIKQAEIGKQIKKASRYEHGSGPSDVLSQLAEEVKEIMREWRDKQQLAIELERQQEKEREKEKERERAAAPELVPTTAVTQQKEALRGVPARENERKQSETGSDKMDVEHSQSAPAATTVASTGRPASTASASAPAPARSTTLLSALLSQQQPNAFSTSLSGGTAASASASVQPTRRAKRPLDMNEGARKLLQRESEREPEREQESFATEPALSVSSVSLAPIDFNSKPLAKGGLKRDNGSSKKEKKSIRWADDEGGSLKQVQTIEVERIKSSVANYKSHKELVKKEKQFEKEAHLSKTVDAMHSTTKWRTPRPLSLSIEIIDNLAAPTECTEIATQTKRMSILMETKFLDESLIPNDPDRSLAEQDAAAHQGLLSEPSPLIPWLMPDEKQEDVYATAAPITSVPSSSSAASSSSSSTFFAPRLPSEDDYRRIVDSLPMPIRMLDPMALEMVLEHPFVLDSLLRKDGGVDELHLTMLQNCSSVEEYRRELALEMERSAALTYGGYGMHADLRTHSAAAGGGAPGAGMHYGPYGTYDRPRDLPLPRPIEDEWNNMGKSYMMGAYGQGPPSSLLERERNFPLQSPSTQPTQQYLHQQPFQATAGSLPPPHSRGGAAGLSLSSVDGSKLPGSSNKKFPTPKNQVPCKFFNTTRGCANGDRCPFGHFLEAPGGGGGGGALPMRADDGDRRGVNRGPGANRARSGPGGSRGFGRPPSIL